MARRLSEMNKVDIAVVPASINGASTGTYYNIGKGRKALFVWEVGAMAAAGTSIGQVMQAQDAAGTGAKAVANNSATITNGVKAASVLLDNTAVHVDGETYTINGIVFTAAAADGGANSRTYAVGANPAASSANLVAKINHATIGVPGVTAAVSTNDVLLTVDEPGEATITVVASAGAQGVPVTQSAIGYVECDENFLDEGFSHVALRVTNAAATQTAAVLVRGDMRYSPTTNQVAAAKVDVEP